MSDAYGPIQEVAGRALPLRGDDVDTDQIIPARYMKAVTFEGLERYAFYDQRFDAEGNPKEHPFNDARYQGASILVVQKNFGCGSSREHAPQALKRWGIRGLVGESFAEIFFGNCVSLGMPCVTLPGEAIAELLALVERAPETPVRIDLVHKRVFAGDRSWPAEIPEGARQRFLEGSWDALQTLLDAGEAIEATAARLPYLNAFRT